MERHICHDEHTRVQLTVYSRFPEDAAREWCVKQLRHVLVCSVCGNDAVVERELISDFRGIRCYCPDPECSQSKEKINVKTE